MSPEPTTEFCEAYNKEESKMVDLDEMVRILDGLDDLPTLPTIYVEISKQIRDPKVSVSEVARVIEMDQAITSKILRLVNSSFFGFSRQVTSIRQAVVLLGFSTVQNTVLSVSVFESFTTNNVKGFNLKEFWKHSIGCGVLCTTLDKKMNVGYQDETFVAGLLHDIGKIILDRHFKKEFEEALTYAKTNGVSPYEGERVVIGSSHDEIGEYLAEQWKLPYALVEAVALHHHPGNIRSNPKLVSLVHLSDCLAHRLGCGYSDNYVLPEFDPYALEELDLNEEMIPELIEEMKQVFDNNHELFKLID